MITFSQEELWNESLHGLLCLTCGRRDLLPVWGRWLREADLPPRTKLMVVDNSRDGDFGVALRGVLDWRRFTSVEVVNRPEAPAGAGRGATLAHIARLYNDALESWNNLHRPDRVLLLEDDLEPPLDGARRLYERFAVEHAAVVGAVYENPDERGRACVSPALTERWGACPPLEAITDCESVGFVGSGFAWYDMRFLCTVLPCLMDGDLGWDAVVCREVRRLRGKVLADGTVRAKHHLEGRPERVAGDW
jgi:hypothetical protein